MVYIRFLGPIFGVERHLLEMVSEWRFRSPLCSLRRRGNGMLSRMFAQVLSVIFRIPCMIPVVAASRLRLIGSCIRDPGVPSDVTAKRAKGKGVSFPDRVQSLGFGS